MRLTSALLLPAAFAPAALAVFADDAYHIDYHNALLGFPRPHATFFQQPVPGSKASLIYTLSERNVLAAVNPKDGTIVWRQLLSSSSNSTSGFLRAGDDQDVIISGVDGQIAAWRASDGRLAWSTIAGASSVKDLEILELEDGLSTAGAKDAIVLSEPGLPTVSRIDGKDGHVKWQYEDNSGDSPFQVLASGTHIYYIALHSTMLGNHKIKVQSLNTVTGARVDQYTLSSDSELSSSNLILFTGANTAAPLVLWTDKRHQVLKVHILGTKTTASFNIENKSATPIFKIEVHAPHRANSRPHFLVQFSTAEGHWAEIFHVDLKKSSVTKAYELPRLSGRGSFATSTVNANVYFTRISENEISIVSSASHGILGRWPLSALGSSLPGGIYPVHTISETAIRSESAQAVRATVLLSDGTWTMVRNGDIAWTRLESLAEIVSAVFADYPEEKELAQELKLEGHQNVVAAYIHRWQRHVKDLQHFPAWAQRVAQKIVTYNPKTPEIKIEKPGSDTFGFHKVVVVATRNGYLLGLDAGGAGQVLWNLELAKFTGPQKFASPKLRALPDGLVELHDVLLSKPLVVNAITGKLVETDKPRTERPASIEYSIQGNELRGYSEERATQNTLWTFVPPLGEQILSFTARPYDDPIASIGRVLGDRRVLYKYLNPNLVLVTATSEKLRVASFYLIDSVSGNVLYSSSHDSVDVTRPITSTVSENWLAYSYSLGNGASSRGPVLVVADLFESSIPDDRGPLGSSSNFSSVKPGDAVGDFVKPHVISQAYHIPEEICHMAVTHTKQGITSRELIVTLRESNSLVGIPRQVLDPRRPVGRDPTASEAAEGLSKYTPVIPFNPEWYLNHKRETFGIVNVITSPSLLESTSLVFAYGLDVFGTRVRPSFSFDVLGKDFNKGQMLLTVAALFVGVLVVAPLVRRKQINAQWQSV